MLMIWGNVTTQITPKSLGNWSAFSSGPKPFIFLLQLWPCYRSGVKGQGLGLGLEGGGVGLTEGCLLRPPPTPPPPPLTTLTPSHPEPARMPPFAPKKKNLHNPALHISPRHHDLHPLPPCRPFRPELCWYVFVFFFFPPPPPPLSLSLSLSLAQTKHS